MHLLGKLVVSAGSLERMAALFDHLDPPCLTGVISPERRDLGTAEDSRRYLVLGMALPRSLGYNFCHPRKSNLATAPWRQLVRPVREHKALWIIAISSQSAIISDANVEQ